jgi:hypothetical protein
MFLTLRLCFRLPPRWVWPNRARVVRGQNPYPPLHRLHKARTGDAPLAWPPSPANCYLDSSIRHDGVRSTNLRRSTSIFLPAWWILCYRKVTSHVLWRCLKFPPASRIPSGSWPRHESVLAVLDSTQQQQRVTKLKHGRLRIFILLRRKQ